MKRTTLSLVMLTCLVLSLLIFGAFTAVSTANAQLGNTGTPVRCTHASAIGSTIGGNGFEQSLTCTRPDGSSFSTVPANNYLLVTDLLILEEDGPLLSYKGALEVKNSGGAIEYSVPFWVESQKSFSEHFTTPYYILKTGDYLNAHNLVTNTYGVNMRFFVSGLLTTNYNYLPLTVK